MSDADVTVTDHAREVIDEAKRELVRLYAENARMSAALHLFIRQWNACGPNSDFGRYFANVRNAAVAAVEGQS